MAARSPITQDEKSAERLLILEKTVCMAEEERD